jgi:hypothetical protein
MVATTTVHDSARYTAAKQALKANHYTSPVELTIDMSSGGRSNAKGPQYCMIDTVDTIVDGEAYCELVRRECDAAWKMLRTRNGTYSNVVALGAKLFTVSISTTETGSEAYKATVVFDGYKA